MRMVGWTMESDGMIWGLGRFSVYNHETTMKEEFVLAAASFSRQTRLQSLSSFSSASGCVDSEPCVSRPVIVRLPGILLDLHT